MSIIRDIRLTAATHLSLPSNVRYAFANLLNELDMELDKEGYDPGERVKKAHSVFEAALFDLTEVNTTTNEEELFADDPDFVDIDDIDLIDHTTEDD